MQWERELVSLNRTVLLANSKESDQACYWQVPGPGGKIPSPRVPCRECIGNSLCCFGASYIPGSISHLACKQLGDLLEVASTH